MIKKIINLFRKKKNYNLSKEDYDFLLDLQHEMLTQDHVSQAAPRFWVVQGEERVWTSSEYSTDSALMDEDYDIVGETIKDCVEYFEDNYGAELKEKSISFREDNSYWTATIKADENDEDDEDEDTTLFDLEDFLEFLEDNDIVKENTYRVGYYKMQDKIYANTMFLTNRSCKEHIRLNHYHYSKNAHSYAMTAWRSPEVSRLFEILDKIDWKLMKEDYYGKDITEKTSSGLHETKSDNNQHGSN